MRFILAARDTHIFLVEVFAMFRDKDEYRRHLEALPYEELLGEEVMNAEVQAEIEGRLDAIQSDLEEMDFEELLGTAQLEDLAQAEIESRLESIRSDLEALDVEDLLDHDHLERPAQEEIERRLEAFEAGDGGYILIKGVEP